MRENRWISVEKGPSYQKIWSAKFPGGGGGGLRLSARGLERYGMERNREMDRRTTGLNHRCADRTILVCLTFGGKKISTMLTSACRFSWVPLFIFKLTFCLCCCSYLNETILTTGITQNDIINICMSFSSWNIKVQTHSDELNSLLFSLLMSLLVKI